MGDVIVDVPGGSNNHNYANVTLIVELARLHGVHAVWAGWGHASENPVLPDTLAKSNPPIKFIGPAGPPMRALGDKIGSTIIAQTAGVPCISWNGEHVVASYDRETGSLPEKAYDEATIANATEACEAADRVGFPVMIKASEVSCVEVLILTIVKYQSSSYPTCLFRLAREGVAKVFDVSTSPRMWQIATAKCVVKFLEVLYSS
jgi:biotin carboxylase